MSIRINDIRTRPVAVRPVSHDHDLEKVLRNSLQTAQEDEQIRYAMAQSLLMQKKQNQMEMEKVLKESLKIHKEDKTQLREAIRQSLKRRTDERAVIPTYKRNNVKPISDTFIISGFNTPWKRINVPADGNCFYHCIVRSINPSGHTLDHEEHVRHLRYLVGEQLKRHQEYFNQFIDGKSYKKYVNTVVNTPEWVDEAQIHALLMALNGSRNPADRLALIIIDTHTNKIVCERVDTTANWFIFLSYDGSHYQMLRPAYAPNFVVHRDCLHEETLNDITDMCTNNIIVANIQDCKPNMY